MQETVQRQRMAQRAQNPHDAVAATPLGSAFTLEGQTIALSDKAYHLQQQVRVNEDDFRVTYFATDEDGEERVVKIQKSPSAQRFIEKVKPTMLRLNALLGTQLELHALNVEDCAIVSPKVPGHNLEELLETEQKAFTQADARTLLRQVAQNYLKPLHDAQLAHRDVKPSNLIASATPEGMQYTLIDYPLTRPSGSQTVTMSMGTLKYSPLTDTPKDDLFGLGWTAYFCLSGKHPRRTGIPDVDEEQRQKAFDALGLEPSLKKILLKLTDVHATYGVDDLLRDLDKTPKTDDDEIDLGLARTIHERRLAKQVPAALQRRINGVQALFKEEYRHLNARSHPFDATFLLELDSVLRALGYELRFLVEDKRNAKTEEDLKYNLTQANINHNDLFHTDFGAIVPQSFLSEAGEKLLAWPFPQKDRWFNVPRASEHGSHHFHVTLQAPVYVRKRKEDETTEYLVVGYPDATRRFAYYHGKSEKAHDALAKKTEDRVLSSTRIANIGLGGILGGISLALGGYYLPLTAIGVCTSTLLALIDARRNNDTATLAYALRPAPGFTYTNETTPSAQIALPAPNVTQGRLIKGPMLDG